MTDRLLTELPSILSWSISGWRRLRERGRFIQPESAEEAIGELEDLGSPVSAFLRDRCVVGAGQNVMVDRIYEAWRGWCAEAGREKPGTKEMFCKDLRAAVPTLRRTQPRSGGTRIAVYEGIGLRV